MTQLTPTDAPTAELTFNADQLELAQAHIKDLHFAVATVAQGLEGKMPLTADLAKNCVAVAEYRLRDLMSVLGVETNGKVEMEARNARLRTANLRIHELEEQLGQSQTPLQTQMGVKQLYERLRGWWQLEGFGHISETYFGPYWVEAHLCGMLFSPHRGIGSKTPASNRELTAQWYASLEERGFVLCAEEEGGAPCIKDCDQSRDTLERLITQRLPSAEIVLFEGRGRRGYMTLNEVKVLIRNYADILTLPQPEAEE